MIDTASLIPVIKDIPGPWGWLSALLFITFVLHLVLMNAVVGVAVISAYNALRGRDDEGLTLAHPLPKGVAIVVNLGVAPLLFLQALYGAMVYSSSIIMALWWLSIMATVMMAYYGLYVFTSPGSFSTGSRNLALCISLLLLVFTAFVQVNNATLMQDPRLWVVYAKNAAGVMLNLADKELWPRFLHVILSCLAVGGLCTAIPARLKLRVLARSNATLPEQNVYYSRMRRGLAWFFHATTLQIPVGVWFFHALPAEQQALFMGGSGLGTALFAVAFLCMIGSLVAAKKNHAACATGLTAVIIVCMAGMRAMVRSSILEPVYTPLITAGEGGPVRVFLASAVFTVVIIVKMVRLYRKPDVHNAAMRTGSVDAAGQTAAATAENGEV